MAVHKPLRKGPAWSLHTGAPFRENPADGSGWMMPRSACLRDYDRSGTMDSTPEFQSSPQRGLTFLNRQAKLTIRLSTRSLYEGEKERPMTKKISAIALMGALWLALASMSAQAQVQVRSQTFFFNGTCTGTDQVFTRPFNPTITATVIGGDIQIFQNPTGGVNYAFAGLAGSTNIIIWDGPQQTHVTSFPGFAGFVSGGTNFLGFGFPVTAASNVVFDLSCATGPWQAFLTLWFVS
jgi:hypothetical protein